MISDKKKILFVTSTRADYGKLKSLIVKVQRNNKFLSKVFVTGMHNLRLYGATIGELRQDKIKGLHVHSNQNKFSKMDEILINTITGFSPVLKKFKPDLVVIHGDRTEPLACALSALLNNFNVVHIEGGEVSGTVDEMLRHAISKISHIHLVSNKIAKKRLVQMGENKKNIFIVGSPDVDVILGKNLPNLSKVKQRYEISFSNYAIGILHPITTNLINLKKEAKIFFNSLVKSGLNYILVYPNNDHGSDIILEEMSKYKNYKKFRIFPSIRFEYYLTLLKNSRFIIGNSSSGIIEAPYYGVSTINIGDRQKNRLKTKLIKNVNFVENSILQTIKFSKNRKINKRKFFGDGKSAEKITKLLLSSKIWNISNQKNFIDII
jgi:UDP-N-acetylglucosamine 2-epimerase (hydrolysing)